MTEEPTFETTGLIAAPGVGVTELVIVGVGVAVGVLVGVCVGVTVAVGVVVGVGDGEVSGVGVLTPAHEDFAAYTEPTAFATVPLLVLESKLEYATPLSSTNSFTVDMLCDKHADLVSVISPVICGVAIDVPLL